MHGELDTHETFQGQLLDGLRSFTRNASGKDVARVNFSLASGTLATVTIDALESGALPLGRDASATLSVLSDLWFSSPESMRQASHQENGPFGFTDVPLGDY